MPEQQNIYDQLLAQGYSRQAIHKVLYHLVMEDIKQQRLYEQKSFISKALWHSNRFLEQYKIYRTLQNLTQQGLCLLKTQWAKKPKQPV